MDKVLYGISNLHIAFRKEDVDGKPSWQTPIHIPGTTGFSPDPNSEESTFHADNAAYYQANQNNGYSGDLVNAKFPNEILAEMLGWMIDENGALAEPLGGRPKQFALMYQVDGDQRGRRIVYYGCTGSAPTREDATVEGSIDVHPETMTITMTPVDLGVDDGNGSTIFTKLHLDYTPANAAAWNNFFKQVYVPTPKTSTEPLAATMAAKTTAKEEDKK